MPWVRERTSTRRTACVRPVLLSCEGMLCDVNVATCTRNAGALACPGSTVSVAGPSRPLKSPSHSGMLPEATHSTIATADRVAQT